MIVSSRHQINLDFVPIFLMSLQSFVSQFFTMSINPFSRNIYSKALRCTFLGNGKTRVAQNSCNLSYLIRQSQEHQKNVQLKVFTTYIHASQIFLGLIQKCALPRSVQLEAVYLEALLYKEERSCSGF